jgi:hypothetical protein
MRLQRKTLAWSGSVALAVITVAIAGCSSFKVASRPTPTATPSATTILADAVVVQQKQIKDVEFSMKLDLTTNNTTLSGDMTGTETASPNRTDLNISNFTVGDAQFSGEIIIDAATNATYILLTGSSILGLPTGEWIKTTWGSFLNPLPINPTQFSDLSQLSGATLIGPETLDGIAVWHLQATKAIDGSTATVDVFIRKDNNQLYELVANASESSSGTIMFKITGINTGATINLPASSQDLSQ